MAGARRSRKRLEEAIARASTQSNRAIAYYELGLFHDNNSREAVAIPNYMEALRLGLDGETRSMALAWLSSSLHKTGRPVEALERCREARASATGEPLAAFLNGLEKRIRASLPG